MNEKALQSASPIIRRAQNLKCRHLCIPSRINFDYLLGYVAEGSIELRIESEKFFRILSQGDIFFIQPGVEHSIRTHTDEQLQIPHIHFDLFPQKDSGLVPVNFKSKKDCSPDELRMIRKDMLSEIPHVLQLVNHAKVKRLILEILSCQHDFDEYRLLQKSLVLNLLYLLLQEISVSRRANHCSDKYKAELTHVAEYISESSRDRIGSEYLARMCRLSPSYFNKLFRDQYCISPSQYYVQCRMEKARELLLSTKLSLEEISDLTGYESIQSFYKAFKKAESLSPGQYRISRRIHPEDPYVSE